ncbi:MAG TPA: permease [Prolixibacteraceae bacterium]|jgi:uncharacterized membrane protein YfcA|nr:permease [Prolixibacteraceae bacterium]
MTLTQMILLAIIGLMAGIFSGSLGVGGAIIVIPALIFFLGFTQHQAQGTSLAFMIPPVTLMAAIQYWKNGYVNWKFALILALAFFVGGYLGSKISISLPDNVLRKAFGGLLLVVAIKLIFWK